ncbi:MAG: hypothetical protein LBK59_02435 [Bifidobacteriaceae bacterium]|nr:hypothetical protein [Bifidobacteriaceae bacterium]
MAAELPATVSTVEGGKLVGWEEGTHQVFSSGPLGPAALIAGPGADAEEVAASDEYATFLASHQTDAGWSYGLVVDGVDYSADYQACAESSDYVDPLTEPDLTDELTGKRMLADATNDWIACARENGYPEWADVEPGVADNWLTSPSATIPLTMTAEDLRSLLAECPNFDEKIAEMQEDPDYVITGKGDLHPSIQVEVPGVSDAAAGSESSYRELTDILGEASADFYAQRAAAE